MRVSAFGSSVSRFYASFLLSVLASLIQKKELRTSHDGRQPTSTLAGKRERKREPKLLASSSYGESSYSIVVPISASGSQRVCGNKPNLLRVISDIFP